jgi:dephospho-CoA kinase
MALTSAAIEDRMEARISPYNDHDDVVLFEAALLVSSPRRYGLTGLLLVDAPEEIALRRLIDGRGMTDADARSRIAAQMPRDERLRVADFVIDNSGPPACLEAQIELAWAWLRSLPDGRFRRESG